MGHLRQTNIDINKYENNRIRKVHSSSVMKEDDIEQENSTLKDQSVVPNIPMDKIALFIVVAILFIAIVFMVNGIIYR